ncbi:MAG: hypothetical protein JXA17_07930 [Dehalococcoidales bacterium]|nr:hypothetical protein [Dehalococcoidales bacterium]
MKESKYGRYVIRKSLAKFEPWPTMEWTGETDYKTNVTFMITRVMAPCKMEEYPHSHDFDMYLHFMSYDYEHMDDLFAEIEIGFRRGAGNAYLHVAGKRLHSRWTNTLPAYLQKGR